MKKTGREATVRNRGFLKSEPERSEASEGERLTVYYHRGMEGFDGNDLPKSASNFKISANLFNREPALALA